MTKPIAAPPMSEADWQSRVTGLCDALRLRWFHSGDSRRDSCPGFPDLVILGPAAMIWVELKRQSGKVSNDQWEWLDHLAELGYETYVWRPSEWPEVERRLRSLAKGS